MCLVVRRAKHEEPLKPRIAKRDIVCYKVMKNVYRGASFVTPYTNTIVVNRFIEGEELMCATGIREIVCICKAPRDNKFVYEIRGGFIHTFQTLKTAKCIVQTLPYSICGYNIFKCVIPKDVNYFKGEDLNAFVSYASDSIRFIERID